MTEVVDKATAIEFLRRAKPRIRAAALRGGTQHSGWDYLTSIEHYTDGTAPYAFKGSEGLKKLVSLIQREYPEEMA